MKYLLDTHIILWLAENSPDLSKTTKEILLNETNKKYISIASCWEVAIKISLKKLYLEGGINEFFRIIIENGFHFIQILPESLFVLETLPFYHRDPFDRLLISTALSEDMFFITADKQISAYKKEKLQIVF